MMRLKLPVLMTIAFLPFPTGIFAVALRAPEHAAETAAVLFLLLAIRGVLLSDVRRHPLRSNVPA